MVQAATTRFVGRLRAIAHTANLPAAIEREVAEFRRDRETGGSLTTGEWRGVLLSARDLLREGRDKAPDFVEAADRILSAEIIRDSDNREQRVREVAERIWIDEGRPEDRAAHHWRQAEAIVQEEDEQTPGQIADEGADPSGRRPWWKRF